MQEPIDIIKNALFEDDNWFDCEHEKRNQLFDWIESRYPMDENVEKEELQKLIEAQCQAILENAKASLLKTAEAFVSFANMNISEMENAYGKMDFIIANDSIRLRAYKKIYDRIRRFKIECKKERSHFELLKRGNGNVSICFDKVIELDRVLYRTEKGNMGHSVYAYMVDELLDELEVFRSMIYHVEPEREEAIPVSMMIDFEKPGTIETIKERKEKQLQEGLTEKAEKQTVV